MNIIIIGGSASQKISDLITQRHDEIAVTCKESIAVFVDETTLRTNLRYDRMIIMQDAVMSLGTNRDTILRQFMEYIYNRFVEIRIFTISNDESVASACRGVFNNPNHLNLFISGAVKPSMLLDLAILRVEEFRGKYTQYVVGAMEAMEVEEFELEPDKSEADAGQPNKKKKGFFSGFKNKEKMPTYKRNTEVPDVASKSEVAVSGVTAKADEYLTGVNFTGEPDAEEPSFGDYGDSAVDGIDGELPPDFGEMDNELPPNDDDFPTYVGAGFGSETSRKGYNTDDLPPDDDYVDEGFSAMRGNGSLSDDSDIDEGISMAEAFKLAAPKLDTFDKAENYDNDAETIDLFDSDFDIEGMVEDYDFLGKSVIEVKVPEVREVIREVRVEVPVEVPIASAHGGGGSLLNQILHGKRREIIVCTGDRRSGVTTTALETARFFYNANVPVLFVDMDIVRYGSLIHMGIEEMIDLEEHKQTGLALSAKNPKVLRNITTPHPLYHYDCLIQMFGTDVKDISLASVADSICLQQYYKVVVVDCPFECLTQVESLLAHGHTMMCLEDSITGAYNLVLTLEQMTAMSGGKFASLLHDKTSIIINKCDNKPSHYLELMKIMQSVFSYDMGSPDWTALSCVGTNTDITSVLKNMLN